MRLRDLLEADTRKKNKLIFFRQTIDSILNKIQGKVIIVFDTETSGLSVKLPWTQVTEIAAVAFDADSGRQLDVFHKKINLTQATRAEIAVQKRNIGPGDRGSLEGPRGLNIPDLFKLSRYGDRDAPRANIDQVFSEFVEFINKFDNPILIAQNAGFDMGQMFAPLKRLGIDRPRFQEVLDTLTLARVWIYPLLRAGAEAGDTQAAQMLQGFNTVDRQGKVRQSFTLKNLGNVFGVPAKHWHSGISDTMQTYGVFMGMMQYLKTAKERGYDQSDEFKKQHASASNAAFKYGKRPAFGSTINQDRKKGIAARGRDRI